MNIKLDQLLDLYLQHKFPPGTGSDHWSDLKTELVVIDDFIVGSASRENLQDIDKNQLPYFYKRLLTLVNDLESYSVIDDEEKREKEIVMQRAKYGLDILNFIGQQLSVNLHE